MDCVPSGGGEDCNDEPVSIPIESITLHENYNATTFKNDIALIRMTKDAPLTCNCFYFFTINKINNKKI